jgi:hypothetical protein
MQPRQYLHHHFLRHIACHSSKLKLKLCSHKMEQNTLLYIEKLLVHNILFDKLHNRTALFTYFFFSPFYIFYHLSTSKLFYYYSNKKIYYHTNFFYFFITSSVFTNSKINNPLLCSVHVFAKQTYIAQFVQNTKHHMGET